ncbi:MAG: hypothetical protein Q4D86_03735 [Pasteurella oralis]|uniref:hypothetical protein n=1 Tax=Pasteurella oralis TaxID=1071947 RepID=UPI00270EDA64|nr:hypothetical protein [Pasteurella oralis]
MKFKHILRIFAFSLFFTLSGCTAGLWAGGQNSSFIPGSSDIISTDIKAKEIAKDTIRAFGRTKDKQQIVMIGDSYWYFISPKQTEQLQTLLNTKLPKAFNTKANKPIRINLTKSAKGFSTDSLWLHYQPKTEREIKIVRELGFRKTSKPEIYAKEYYFEGEIYKKAENIKLEYQFETTLPVSINTLESETNIDGSLLLTKIAATPVALATDIILLPVLLITLPFVDY